MRTFAPGDKVLVLLPMPGKPLHAKFHGPYIVEEQLGPVDYIIATPDRRKTKRVCHVNLLKKYVDRDPTWKMTIDDSNSDVLQHNPPADILVQTTFAMPIDQTLESTSSHDMPDDRMSAQQ